jgi:hypothetical protein
MFKPKLFYLFAAILCRIIDCRNKNLAIFADPLADCGGVEVRTRQRSESRRSSAGEAEKLTSPPYADAETPEWARRILASRWAILAEAALTKRAHSPEWSRRRIVTIL